MHVAEHSMLMDPRSLQRFDTPTSDHLGTAGQPGHGSLLPAFRGVFATSALFSAVFAAYFAVALPRLCVRSWPDFALSVVFLLLGSALGAASMTTEMGIWSKVERVPRWFRIAIVAGMFGFVFALPFAILAMSVSALVRRNKKVLSTCKQACLWLSGAGLLQLVLALMLQSVAMVVHDLGMALSVAVSFLMLVKVAAEHDTHDHVYLYLRYLESSSLRQDHVDAVWEESSPLITGPLASLLCWRGALICFFRAAEIASSLSVVVLFGIGTRSKFALGGIGMGGPLVVILQFVAQLVLFQLSSSWMSGGLMRSFVACVFIPKPTLDSNMLVLHHYVVMGVAQLLATMGCATALLRPLPSRAQLVAMVCAVALMWGLLLATRYVGVKTAMPGGAVELADKVKVGIVQIQPLEANSASLPQVLSFCQAFSEHFFGPAFLASSHSVRLDLSSSQLEANSVSTALRLVSPLLRGVTHFKLDLQGTSLTDGDLIDLVEYLPSTLISLEVNLAGTKVGDVGVATLAQHLPPTLRRLEAGLNSIQITDKGVAIFAQHLPEELEHLEAIFYNTKLGDVGLMAIADHLPGSLTHFRAGLFRTQVGDAGVQALAESLPAGLTVFKAELSGTHVGDDGALALYEHLPRSLEHFECNLTGTQVTDDVKATLAGATLPTFHGRSKYGAIEDDFEEKTYCCQVFPFGCQ